MKETVVSDSTCLIGLERVGELDILPALFDSVMIPPEVEREFDRSFKWLKVENLTSDLLATTLQMIVDAGEAEAIALASEKNCLLIYRRQTSAGGGKTSRRGGYRNCRHSDSRQTKRHNLGNQTDFNALEANDFFISRRLREEALKIDGE